MATFSISNVKIAGLSACVPKQKFSNLDNPIFNSIEDAEKFITTTGMKERRIGTKDQCTSDLCQEATEKLLSALDWKKEDIELLVLVTQTPDYISPMTSGLIQDRLGLPKSCITFDVPQGCSGYVYGLSIVASMMSATKIRKAIFLAGDTLSKQASPKDQSTQPLFADAGTATALIFDEDAEPMHFDMGSDGSGYQAIMLKDGGYRSPFSEKSLEYVDYGDGIVRNNCNTVMEGMDVFSFAISTAPATYRRLLEYTGLTNENTNFAIFHQANRFMNETIRKKLKLKPEQVPYSLDEYGNSASATIPITMVARIQEQLQEEELTLMMCGFGVGLSWGTAQINTKNIICLPIIEI